MLVAAAAAAGWNVCSGRRSLVVASMPERVHQPYTRDDDALLWANRDWPPEEVASTLGRGAKSCAARLERLRSPTTEGHLRLFGAADADDEGKAAALRPARECIQRIIYDPALSAADFVVGYRDRFEPGLLRAPFEAPNQSVGGAARMLVLALPEHRIEALWFRRHVPCAPCFDSLHTKRTTSRAPCTFHEAYRVHVCTCLVGSARAM